MAGIRFGTRLSPYLNDEGKPLAAGTLTFSLTGTTTLRPTYSDSGLSTPNLNPLTLDASGFLPTDVFLDPAITYRAILKDSSGAVIGDEDPLGNADVSAAIQAHNDDLDAHYAATETQRGFVELATDAEAQAGTSTNRVLTPANLQTVTATESRKGVVEMATTTEAGTGTDTARAVAPAGLTAWLAANKADAATTKAGTSTTTVLTPGGFAGNKTLATSGHFHMPGFGFAWGTGPSTTDSDETFTFETAFATACLGCMAVQTVNGATLVLPVVAKTKTGFTINRSTDYGSSTPPFQYFAWGY